MPNNKILLVPKAHAKRSRSPPRPTSAPRFAYVDALDHVAEEYDEDDTQDHEEDAADGEHEEPSMATHTHLAATILDQAMQHISASVSNHARSRREWLIDLKRDIIDATHIPLTRTDLAIRSAKGPGKKPPTGELWPTSMETISRSVATYNTAAGAAEHDACDQIVASIGAYARTLRRRTHRPDEFINLLHQWIENRSINVALRKTLDGDFTEQTCWQRFNPEERLRATEILMMSFDIVRASGDMLRSGMDSLRK